MEDPGVDLRGGSTIFHEFWDANFCMYIISEIEIDFTLGIGIVFAVLVLHVIIDDIWVSIKFNMY